MKALKLLVLVVTLGMTLVACGGDDASPVASTVPSDSEDGGDSTESGDVDSSVADDASTGGGRTIVIDPASMPSPGDGQFEVEGTTHDFAAADAAGGPASSCSVDPAAIVVELQLSPGALLLQANSADGENWQGMVTISPPGSDRIYFSTPGFEGTFAVQDTMTIYEGDFFWRTSDDPAAREEAGIGTVRVTC